MAGVVDQRVDAAEARGKIAQYPVDLRMVGDVELNRMGGLAKLGGEFGQRFGIAVDQDDAPARSHDGAGDCTSQPAGRTGQKHRATAVFGHDITSAMRSEEHTSELQSLMRI